MKTVKMGLPAVNMFERHCHWVRAGFSVSLDMEFAKYSAVEFCSRKDGPISF